MTDVSRIQLGGAADGSYSGSFTTDNALWLKTFGGEVLAAFDQLATVTPLITTRTIPSGKSASFPVTGRSFARAHKPGEDILDAANTATVYRDTDGAGVPGLWASGAAVPYLNQSENGEKIILVDDLTIATTFLDDFEQVKAHYDMRSIHTQELGRALARRADNMAARAFYGAAKSTTAVGGMRGGQTVTLGSDDADGLVAGVLSALQGLDERDVPREDRFCLLAPEMYYALLGAAGVASNAGALVSKDYSAQNGDFAKGEVLRIAGCPIVVSPNLGFGVDFTAAEQGVHNADVQVDMSSARGIVAHKSAAGMLKVKDIVMESEYQVQRQGHVFVAKMACGYGSLRQDAAIALDV